MARFYAATITKIEAVLPPISPPARVNHIIVRRAAWLRAIIINMINDDYPTCSKTFITLRLYHAQAEPEEATTKLGIAPTSVQNGWFLSSEGKTESKDAQRHLEWLLAQLNGKDSLLYQLQNGGWEMDVSCYWASQNGHGGPTLSPFIMCRLSELRLELWFDFYNFN